MSLKYEDLLGKEIWDVLDEKIQEEPGAFLSAINSYATVRKIFVFIYSLMNMIISPIPFFRLTVRNFIGKQRMAKVLFVASLT